MNLSKDITFTSWTESRRSSLSFAIKTLVEILRRVLGGYDTDLEDKIIPWGSNPGDRPPLIKRPDTNPTELRDLTVRDPTRYLVRICREVVIWRKAWFCMCRGGEGRSRRRFWWCSSPWRREGGALSENHGSWAPRGPGSVLWLLGLGPVGKEVGGRGTRQGRERSSCSSRRKLKSFESTETF